MNSLNPRSILTQSSLSPLSIFRRSSRNPHAILPQPSLNPRSILAQSLLNPHSILLQSTLYPHSIHTQSSINPHSFRIQSSLNPHSLNPPSLNPHSIRAQSCLHPHSILAESSLRNPLNPRTKFSLNPRSQSTLNPPAILPQSSHDPTQKSIKSSNESRQTSSQYRPVQCQVQKPKHGMDLQTHGTECGRGSPAGSESITGPAYSTQGRTDSNLNRGRGNMLGIPGRG
jgi:hypothetical protein